MKDLCACVAARLSKGMPVPMIVLIWAWLNRIKNRILALMARIEAGTLPIASRPRPGRPRPAAPPKPRLPRGFAWLLVQIPYEAAGYASQLRYLLTTNPEMMALLAATPLMARTLRPLYRMLGIEADVLTPKPALAPAPDPTAPPLEPAVASIPPDDPKPLEPQTYFVPKSGFFSWA